MPRITAEEESNYQSSGNGEWFQLKNNMDVARVQFMFNNPDEIERFAVHQVEVNNKKRYVNCLRTYDQPVDLCPFCAEGIKVQTVKFIVMFQHDDQKVKIWERGKEFIEKVQSQFNRYGGNGAFQDQVFEIERHGVAGDKNTKYELFHMDAAESFDLSDNEYPDIDGGLVLNKDFDEMNVYLDTGKFPDDDAPASNPPPQSARRDTGRRMPANNPPAQQARRAPAAAPASQPTQPVMQSRRGAPATQPAAAAPTASRQSAPAQPAQQQTSRGSRRGGNQETF